MPMVSLQIPEDILEKFDTIQRESAYISRSEALRDAILQFIQTYEDKRKMEGIKRAIISVSYKSDLDTLEILSGIDHRFEVEIKTFSEYVLDNNTIRVYIAIGDINRLNDFLFAFNRIKESQTNIMFI